MASVCAMCCMRSVGQGHLAAEQIGPLCASFPLSTFCEHEARAQALHPSCAPVLTACLCPGAGAQKGKVQKYENGFIIEHVHMGPPAGKVGAVHAGWSPPRLCSDPRKLCCQQVRWPCGTSLRTYRDARQAACVRLAEGFVLKPLKLHRPPLQHHASACTAQDRLSSASQMAEPGGACLPLQGPVSPLNVLCCAVPCRALHGISGTHLQQT